MGASLYGGSLEPALVLLPTLLFLDLVTFERALELGIEDYIYAAGMSRIRHLYVEMVPRPRSTLSVRYTTTSRLPWLPLSLACRFRLGSNRSSPSLAP
jgi:hypothetical protein